MAGLHRLDGSGVCTSCTPGIDQSSELAEQLVPQDAADFPQTASAVERYLSATQNMHVAVTAQYFDTIRRTRGKLVPKLVAGEGELPVMLESLLRNEPRNYGSELSSTVAVAGADMFLMCFVQSGTLSATAAVLDRDELHRTGHQHAAQGFDAHIAACPGLYM